MLFIFKSSDYAGRNVPSGVRRTANLPPVTDSLRDAHESTDDRFRIAAEMMDSDESIDAVHIGYNRELRVERSDGLYSVYC